MKGLIVKSKDKTCKAGIPQCGVGIVANITWHSGLTWTLSGLKMPEEVSGREVCGMRGVAVKCIDITQNSDCEGSIPAPN